MYELNKAILCFSSFQPTSVIKKELTSQKCISYRVDWSEMISKDNLTLVQEHIFYFFTGKK